MIRTLATLALLPAVAYAGGVRLTDSLTLQLRTIDVAGASLDPVEQGDVDKRYGALINRLSIQGSAGGLTTFARVDAVQFLDAPRFQPEQARFADDARLERLRVRYRLGDWNLVAGDFFEQLGRGIVLSVRKVDELGVDIEVRGGRLEYDGSAVGAILFAGRMNPANLDVVSERFVEDTDDVIMGGRVAIRAVEGVEFGLIGAHLRPEEQALEGSVRELLGVDEDDQSTGGGAFVEVPELTEWLSFYGEGDYQKKTLAGEDSTGKAAYGTLNFTFDGLNLLAEGMHLDDYEVRGSSNSALGQSFTYNQAPTLERLDQIVLNTQDFSGGRLYIEPYFLDGDLTVYVNGLFRLSDPGEDAEIRQLHGYGGVRLAYQGGRSRLEISGGWREEEQTETGERVLQVTHAEVDWLQSLGSSSWALHLQSRNDLRTQATPDGENDFVWSSTILSIDRASVASLAVELGMDTQDQSEGAQQIFLAGILDLHVDGAVRALGWGDIEPVTMRATVGDQRGGIKCIAGICRDFPAFSGVKINIVARHTLGG